MTDPTDAEPNIFEAINGLSGENLATGILAYLLKHEPYATQAKKALGQVLGLSIEGEIEVATEVATSGEGQETGRIDLVIEERAAPPKKVIGIEVKFLAPLRPNQPEMYLETLIARAGGREHVTLCLLAPRDYDLGNLELANIYRINWEDLRTRLQAYSAELSDRHRFVFDHFLDYIDLSIDPFARLARDTTNLCGSGRATQWKPHDDYVRALRPFFAHASRVIVSGPCVGFFVGSYLNSFVAWVGFVEGTKLDPQRTRPFELVLAASKDLDVPKEFDRRTVHINHFLGTRHGRTVPCWIIPFDAKVDRSEQWRDRTQPLAAALERAFAAESTQQDEQA